MKPKVRRFKESTPLKVGLMTMEFLNPWGGIATYCLDLCEALSDKVKFFVFTAADEGKDLPPSKKDLGPNVEVHTICRAGGVAFTNWTYQMALTRSIAKVIREYDLDLVHSGSTWAVTLGMSGHLSIPQIVTSHSTIKGQRRAIANSGSTFRELHNSEKATVLLYPFLRTYEAYNISRMRHIIATSNTVKGELVNGYNYRGKVSVVQNGINASIFQPAPRADWSKGARILFSGRLISLKGPQVLMKAMPQVLKQHPDTVFIFAGPGNRAPYLEMLREMHIPESNYEFCQVSYADMPQLYTSADLLILPSLTEGFPKCILEGMACGLPAIASNVGDVADLVRDGETGFLINKGDVDMLADRINLLLNDEGLRRRMAQNARQTIMDDYSVEVMARKTLDIYLESIEDNAG